MASLAGRRVSPVSIRGVPVSTRSEEAPLIEAEGDMLLEGKRAVVYGGGGSIGGAMARAFGREGATVFLAGRTRRRLETVANDIRAAGGAASTSAST
jgi:FlaA1/EpsC-like NDP-sugar epimerase